MFLVISAKLANLNNCTTSSLFGLNSGGKLYRMKIVGVERSASTFGLTLTKLIDVYVSS